MKKMLFIRIFTIITLAAAICCGIATFFLALNEESTQKTHMRSHLELMKLTYQLEEVRDEELAQVFSQQINNARVVFINSQGEVFADTTVDGEVVEVHKERPEVILAKENGFGTDIRISKTLGKRQIYAAILADEGDFIRISYTLNGPVHFVIQFIPVMVAAMVGGIIIALLFARKVSDSVTNSLIQVQSSLSGIREGDYNTPIPRHKYREFDYIIGTFNDIRTDIKDSVNLLDRERNRANFILESMEEGLVLINGNMEIILANSAAKSFFACESEVEGKSIYHLTRNRRIVESMGQSVENKQSELFHTQLADQIVAVHITPVSSSLLESRKNQIGQSIYSGGLMVLTDATAEKSGEKMRQEFFSNAGHELKTPLTSIMGFAEILASNIAPEENRDSYIEKILAESKRMSALINDILEISRLETNPQREEKVNNNLTEITGKIKESLAPQLAEKNLTFTIHGEEVHYLANEKHIHELLENIITNSVKYNRENGLIKVYLSDNSSFVEIKVQDTGIGIPTKAMGRVFERFFRVDKGRSTKAGSTGLGLSIVKHIVNAYDGEISLESKPDVGTTITIRLPRR